MPTSTARPVARSLLLAPSAASPPALAPPAVAPAAIARPTIALPSAAHRSLVPLPAALARGGLRLAPARSGDHLAIHELLAEVFHGPSTAEFQAQLDEPGYEPSNRLIVRDSDQIAAHLRLAPQSLHVGSAQLPAARFMDLATLPEYRSRGLASTLIAAGERAAVQRGIVLGLARTRAPRLFARMGWSVCGSHVFSTAAPPAVLAELASRRDRHQQSAPARLLTPRPMPLDVRPLRRIELPALMRLYEENARGQSGWPVRTPDYWTWLLARGAFARITIASTTPDARDFGELVDSIVGYAVAGRSRLMEVVAAPGMSGVADRLVEQVCSDAREQEGWLVRLDAPPGDPLHDLFCQAGGSSTISRELRGEWYMAKVLDPQALLHQMAGTLRERAIQSNLPVPCELDLELVDASPPLSRAATCATARLQIRLTESDGIAAAGTSQRHSIRLSRHDLAPLLLGDVSAAELRDGRRLFATTARADTIAAGLFPCSRWYRPPWDDLLA